MTARPPRRGEVWMADLNPVRGHEQAGRRPVLVVSTSGYNAGPAGLVVVVPVTSTRRPVRWHVPVGPPEGGVVRPSSLLCDAVRSVSLDRLGEPVGDVSPDTMDRVGERLRILLEL